MLNIFQLVKVWTWEAQPKYPSDFSSISPMHRTRLGPINWPNQIGRVDKAGKRYEINMRDGYWNTNLKWLVLLYKSTSEVHNHAHGYWGTTSLFPPPTTCQLASSIFVSGVRRKLEKNIESNVQDHMRGRRDIATQNLKTRLMSHFSYKSNIISIYSRCET
jgi:hypothetical protein